MDNKRIINLLFIYNVNYLLANQQLYLVCAF